jgi:predicted 3-demethylubiquinone-9 3-methyltransferase (glyoxalase superfamily)
MLLNAGPYFKFNPSISFSVACSSKNEVNEIWKKLSPGSKVMMELGEYPFSAWFGWLEDKFGLSWQIMLTDSKITQKITPMLMFVGKNAGKAEEAIKLYASIFHESKIDHLMKYGPNEGPDKPESIKHAGFTLEGLEFAAMDSALPHEFQFNEAISFLVKCQTQEEIDYFKKKTSIHPALESRLRQILNDEGFEAALQRQAAHINPESFNDWCLRYSRWGNDGCPIKLPNKTESERRWSRFLDQITRTFKKISYEKMSPLGLKAVNQTSRLLNPVGFSGKDRIICLIEILPPAKGSYSYRLLIHYGNPPEQLKTDWQAKEGQWIVVNKREEI